MIQSAEITPANRKQNNSGDDHAFTLIELLIVVLIIAILAAIAIPNFLEFQTRAKVSRAMADMRTMSTGIEAYLVDTGTYPLDGDDIDPFNPANFDVPTRLQVLTTPIAYLTNLPEDPFHREPVDMGYSAVLFQGAPPYTFIYNTFGNFTGDGTIGIGPANNGNPNNYTLTSLGPSRSFDSQMVGFSLHYDPSNGTVSEGDIHRSGGDRIDLGG